MASTNPTPTSPEPRPLHPTESPSSIARTGYDAGAQQYLTWTNSLASPRMTWLDKFLTYISSSSSSTSTSKPAHDDTHQTQPPSPSPSPLQGLRILELGCGAGVPTTLHIAKTTGGVVGLDISEAQIELARKYFSEAGVEVDGEAVQLRAVDILEAEFPEGGFDGICAFYSIIHLAVEDQEVLLRRCFDWLRPGGWLLFNMGTQASGDGGMVVEGWLGAMKAYWASPGAEGMRRVLERIGYEVRETGRDHVEGDADFTWFVGRRSLEGDDR
jgi:SAM-dependent methyltransferase